MFNENFIYGHAIARRDTKGRVMLPRFTKAEKDDEVVLVEYRTFYKIISKSILDDILEEIDLDIRETFMTDIDRVEELMDYRDYLLRCVIRDMRIDSQCRATIGDVYKDEEYVHVLGAGDGIYLLNEEEYTRLSSKKKALVL